MCIFIQQVEFGSWNIWLELWMIRNNVWLELIIWPNEYFSDNVLSYELFNTFECTFLMTSSDSFFLCYAYSSYIEYEQIAHIFRIIYLIMIMHYWFWVQIRLFNRSVFCVVHQINTILFDELQLSHSLFLHVKMSAISAWFF